MCRGCDAVALDGDAMFGAGDAADGMDEGECAGCETQAASGETSSICSSDHRRFHMVGGGGATRLGDADDDDDDTEVAVAEEEVEDEPNDDADCEAEEAEDE